MKDIHNKQDYEATLAQIQSLLNSEPGSPEDDLLDVLSTLVEVYEEKHYRIDPPDPIEAIKFRMEQGDISRAGLAKYLGGRNRVAEVMSGKLPLSLRMIENLHYKLGVPLKSLVKAYQRTLPVRIMVDAPRGVRPVRFLQGTFRKPLNGVKK